ncbi:MAG: cytochrome P450 [Cyanobacteria bacterium P01_A01_bin.123]
MQPPPLVHSPKIAQKLRWALDPIGYLNQNRDRYGDLFGGDISGALKQPLYLVGHPEAIQFVLSHDTRELSAPGEANALLESVVGRNSMMLIDGDRHRKRRQIVMPPFHGERLKSYGELICQLTHEVIDQWPLNQPFCARDAMQTISMRVILQVVFGLYAGDRYKQLETLMAKRLGLVSSPVTALLIFFPMLQADLGPWSPGGYIKPLQAEIDRLLYDEIRTRRAELTDEDPSSTLKGHRTDILSLLISARDETGVGMTDEELRDELITLLFAGHETTATALAWALYWAHARPDVYTQLMDERATLGANPTPMAIVKLPYLSAFCNETLRINPVGFVTFPRRVEQPINLLGYALEPGMLLMGCIYMLHRYSSVYSEPAKFRPERFIDHTFSPYEFMPFGNGTRRCVGAALAQYELKLAIATILSRCQLKLAKQQSVVAQRRGVTLAPRGGVMLQLLERQPVAAASTAI